MTESDALLHATTVAIDGQGVMITGPSGSGKSALALQLIALGATLVADDQTQVCLVNGQVIANAPPSIKGLIEARGIGLIRLPTAEDVPVSLVVDLAHSQEKRMPEPHSVKILGQSLPCVHNVEAPHFPSALMLYIKGTLET